MIELLASLLVVILAAGLITSSAARRLTAEDLKLVWLALALHVVSSITQVLVTKYYFEGGDMFVYYNTGIRLAELVMYSPREYFWPVLSLVFGADPFLPIDVMGSGSATGAMSGITALLAIPLGGSLYAICIFFGVVALSGQLAMYWAVRPAFPEEYHRRLLMAALLVPSVVFWSSAILKEPFAVAGVGWVALGFRLFVFGGSKIRGVLAIGVGVPLIMVVKPYILFPLAISLGAWWYWAKSQRKKKKRGIFVQVVYLLIAGALTVGALYYLGQKYPQYAVDNVAKETAQLQSLYYRQKGGSTFEYGESTEERQIWYAPMALVSALYRPFFFEVHNAASAVNAVEMFLILILTPWILLNRSSRRRIAAIARSPTMVFMVSFVVILGIATGLGSPNLGSLSRYRIPMMPFYVMILLVLAPAPVRRRAKQLRGPNEPPFPGRMPSGASSKVGMSSTRFP